MASHAFPRPADEAQERDILAHTSGVGFWMERQHPNVMELKTATLQPTPILQVSTTNLCLGQYTEPMLCLPRTAARTRRLGPR